MLKPQEGKKEKTENTKTEPQMADWSSNISIISLTINGLNTLIKKSEFGRLQKLSNYCLSIRNSLQNNDIARLKLK